ncbi:efflux RND transporter periplasmic adaptor subunit [Thalassoroseus pseudoceratinae]|uniref:efflux RND transporter periplasmic adaptor subunit n=1 Tax=Thalassoroseus pseudoceratinae TaxID=2713176 RepID=UPI0014205D7E|nr:efflux RND transporter periplasmic adaptor subunit [Thalassoroseus pseudoceratinae]
MTGSVFLRAGGRVIVASIFLSCLFAGGTATGLWLYPQVFPATAVHDDHDPHEEEEHDHEEQDHVALTKQAFENLNLRLGRPIHGDYWKSILVPGKVVEIPGRSDLAVSTPVAGVIESVTVTPGESIPMESPLFEIRLTDEALLSAQAKYLETLTQQEVAQQEIERLTPLIDSGVVAGAKKRELEYEVKQLVAKQVTTLQELRGRGMPESQINELRRGRTLASTLAVFAPKFVRETHDRKDTPNGYSIENLLVHPGKAVTRGESLCTVAYHQKLYVEGMAFEADLSVLKRIAREGWQIDAETVVDSHTHSHATPVQLDLLRVDNHVDDATQTVRFFLELPNQVTETLTEDGRQFEQWRFRPGQRLHLRLPVERWENQITLPIDAVVIDGPNVFVFAEHHHDDDPEVAEKGLEEHPHDPLHDSDHDVFIELESVPVHLLHRDDKTAVIADDGQLHDDERIALNSAYKLYLALKMQAGGGGGHHHDH